MAIRSAKTLIDFTNIGIETEVLDMQGNKRPGQGENIEIELEEVIVFDDENGDRAGSIASNKSMSRRSNLGDPGKVSMTSETTHMNNGAGSI